MLVCQHEGVNSCIFAENMMILFLYVLLCVHVVILLTR